jgi:hypothetical protein
MADSIHVKSNMNMNIPDVDEAMSEQGKLEIFEKLQVCVEGENFRVLGRDGMGEPMDC